MYDFTHCISDALEVLRTLCVRLSSRTTVACTTGAGQHHHSCSPAPVRILAPESEYTVMSKRKLNLLVTDKHVEAGMTRVCRPFPVCVVVVTLCFYS